MLVGYVRQVSYEDTHREQFQEILKSGVSAEDIWIETQIRMDAQGPILVELVGKLSSGDKLIVFRLSSLARTVQGLVDLFEDFEKREIAIQSIQEKIDTSSEDSKAFFQYSRAIASFTEDLRREKIMKSLAASSHKGGRPPALNDQEVQEVVNLLKNGESISEIARKFKTPRTTIYRIRDRHL